MVRTDPYVSSLLSYSLPQVYGKLEEEENRLSANRTRPVVKTATSCKTLWTSFLPVLDLQASMLAINIFVVPALCFNVQIPQVRFDFAPLLQVMGPTKQSALVANVNYIHSAALFLHRFRFTGRRPGVYFPTSNISASWAGVCDLGGFDGTVNLT
jgi:hypothetical protein